MGVRGEILWELYQSAKTFKKIQKEEQCTVVSGSNEILIPDKLKLKIETHDRYSIHVKDRP